MQRDSRFGRDVLGRDRFVEAPGGRMIRTMTAGDGDDLVVLEAGMGMSGLSWGPVHARIARAARVVAYERAGYGASDPAGRGPRDLAGLAADLATVVAAFPHRRLVLVGHSWGGPIVRTCAAGHLADRGALAGIVLVDQSDEHAADLYLSRPARAAAVAQTALLVPLARARLLAPMLRPSLRGLPADLLAATLAASTTVAAARACAAEAARLPATMRGLRAAPPELGGVPARVVSGQLRGRSDRAIRTALVAAHRRTANALDDARFVPAERSAHMVPITEPELVAAEALALLGPGVARG